MVVADLDCSFKEGGGAVVEERRVDEQEWTTSNSYKALARYFPC